MINLAPIFIIFSFFVSSCSQSQEYPDSDLEYYSFINYQKNRLILPKINSFDTFFKDLDNLILKGEGKINIVNIGDSHIQADMMTEVVREKLQTFFLGANGGRAAIFPYKVANTNNPDNYTVEYNGNWNFCKNTRNDCLKQMGIAGYVIFTNDLISTISINLKNNKLKYDFNKIKIFCNYPKDAYKINIENINESEVKQDKTDDFVEFYFKQYLSNLEIKISKIDTTTQESFCQHFILLENDNPGITYSAFGVNGASSQSFLRCSLLGKQIKILNPDLVILSLGTNDSYGNGFDKDAFILTYTNLIKEIRYSVPDALILLTTPPDYTPRKGIKDNNEAVNKAIWQVAKKENCAIWDLFTVMGGNKSIIKWKNNKLAQNDNVHFTQKGYEIQGKLLFNAIINSYDQFIEERK